MKKILYVANLNKDMAKDTELPEGSYPILEELTTSVLVWDQDNKVEVLINKELITYGPFSGLPNIVATMKERSHMEKIYNFLDSYDNDRIFRYNPSVHTIAAALPKLINKAVTKKQMTDSDKPTSIIFDFFEFKDSNEITYMENLLKLSEALGVKEKVQEYWFQFDCKYGEEGRSENFSTFFINGAISECVYALNKRLTKEALGDSWEYSYDALNDFFINRENKDLFITEILITKIPEILILMIDDMYFDKHLLSATLERKGFIDSDFLNEEIILNKFY